MKWFILVVGIVVLCLVVALILGLAGGGLGRNTTSLSHEPLPDEPIRDTDFDDLVFDVGARGYRMSQVDGVVDRLRRELREKDEEIAVLRGDSSVPAERAGTHPAADEQLTEVAHPAEPAEPAEVDEAAGTHLAVGEQVTAVGEPVEPADSAEPDESGVSAEPAQPAESESESEVGAEPAQPAEQSGSTVGRERTT